MYYHNLHFLLLRDGVEFILRLWTVIFTCFNILWMKMARTNNTVFANVFNHKIKQPFNLQHWIGRKSISKELLSYFFIQICKHLKYSLT